MPASYPGVVDKLIVLAAPHVGLSQRNRNLKQMRRSWYVQLFQVGGKCQESELGCTNALSLDLAVLLTHLTLGRVPLPRSCHGCPLADNCNEVHA